jgi:hypothetical protein
MVLAWKEECSRLLRTGTAKKHLPCRPKKPRKPKLQAKSTLSTTEFVDNDDDGEQTQGEADEDDNS